jgi:acetolactate synthase-1/2/3 large subunit
LSEITVNQYIIQTLADHKITHIFGLTGARIVSFIQCVYEHPDLKFVNVLHEQSAAYAACGFAQTSGKLGVAVSTSGPGATNLLTGVAQAFCDSIPVLFITGQSPTKGMRGQAKIRNRSVQEVDIVGMAAPVTKYAVCVKDAARIRYELEKAIFVTLDGRPGPTLIDLPEDVQFRKIEPDGLERYTPEPRPDITVPDITDICANSVRPIVLLGNGAHVCEREINEYIERTNVPVVASMSAVDICHGELNLPDKKNHSHQKYYLGVCGNYGHRCANFALQNADLVVSLGCGLTPRYTGADVDKFAPNAKVIRVDIDPEELADRAVKPDEIKICCDLREFSLPELKPSAKWLSYIANLKQKYYREYVTYDYGPYSVMDTLDRLKYDIVTADDGQNQIWALQTLTYGKFISTSGLSAMGYALPAAIGAYYAELSRGNKARILCLCGDGGLQMGIYELQTIVREKLPITIVVLNNRALGMVKMLQDTYYDAKHYATTIDYTVPDFCAVAKAYGIRSVKVDTLEGIERAVPRNPIEPALIEVMLDPESDVRPRIVRRRPIHEQFPFLSENEAKENMWRISE